MCVYYVISCSSIFFINGNAMLCRLPNDGLDVRYVDLLKNIGLEKEIVDIDFIPESLDVDFKLAKEKLLIYREQSQSFLKLGIF